MFWKIINREIFMICHLYQFYTHTHTLGGGLQVIFIFFFVLFEHNPHFPSHTLSVGTDGVTLKKIIHIQ